MSGIIGKKVGITSLFDAGYRVAPLAGIQAMPRVVTQAMFVAADECTILLLARGEQKKKIAVKPLKAKSHKTNSGPTQKLDYKTYNKDLFMGDAGSMRNVMNTNQRKRGQR